MDTERSAEFVAGSVRVGGPDEPLTAGSGPRGPAPTQDQGPVGAAGDAVPTSRSREGRATGPWPEPAGPLPTGRTHARPTPWPPWAARQILAAAQLAAQPSSGRHLAAVLYDQWYCPVVTDDEALVRPLTGVYRLAHAGAGTQRLGPGAATVRRHDAIGTDGWWRTWGEVWRPRRRRRDFVRLLLSPHPHAAPAVVHEITARLLDADHAWVLAAATDARRLRRSASVVLDVPSLDALPTGLLEGVTPLLLPVTPPLALPVAPGIGMVAVPDSGMSFGEHRCHLLALALRDGDEPLARLAHTFVRHRLDPARPWAGERPARIGPVTGGAGRDAAG